jgi:ubiquinone/menaquinone biosynthesis C-methylase UbiE
MEEEKRILDVCFGSGMFYYDKEREDLVTMDIRRVDERLCDNRRLVIDPDIIGDFRNIPFPDDTFSMVVFDPPHLIQAGDSSWLVKKYGKLDAASWAQDISLGFEECMRVLKPSGTLIFKWNEQQVALSELLRAIPYKPILGNKNDRSKTFWLVFMK